MGESTLEPAARVDDSVGHTYKKALMASGLFIGLAVGVALLFIPGVGEEADAEIISLFAEEAEEVSEFAKTIKMIDEIADALELGPLGSEILGALTKLFPKDEHAGKIKDGAKRTWTESKRNARITDPLECKDPAGTNEMMALVANAAGGVIGAVVGVAEGLLADAIGIGQHTGAKVARGSKTVFIEGRNAARRADKTSCGGWISEGADKTFIGGKSVTLEGTEELHEEGAPLAWTIWIITKASDLLGVVGSLTDPFAISIAIVKGALGIYGDMYPEERERTEAARKVLESIALLHKKPLKVAVPIILGKGVPYLVGGEEPEPEKPTIVSYP